jgi:hypothetical protein
MAVMYIKDGCPCEEGLLLLEEEIAEARAIIGALVILLKRYSSGLLSKKEVIKALQYILES